MNIPRIAIAAACLIVLAACGNKGPLVLPQKPQPVVTDLPAVPASEQPAETPPADPVPPADSKADGDGTPR